MNSNLESIETEAIEDRETESLPERHTAGFDVNPIYAVLCYLFSALAVMTFIALVIIRLLADS